MEIDIRSVEPQDRNEWLRLRTALWPESPEDHPQEIDAFFRGELPEPAAVLVATVDGQLVGLAELSIRACAEGCSSRNVGYLEGWYVQSEQRRQGVGRSLIAAAEQWAADQGCSEFASDAEVDNEASRQAHLACGFRETGVIRCFIKRLQATGKEE